jgi:hypothetical protein
VVLIGDGKSIDFWRDKWCGNFSPCKKFPNLYEICQEKNATVEFLAKIQWHLSFRRWLLSEHLQDEWRKLKDILLTVILTNERDKSRWLGEKNGCFSVKSTYDSLLPNKKIWRAKNPS